jgi:5-methylcytosine-specific restriction endonuclease McrA
MRQRGTPREKMLALRWREKHAHHNWANTVTRGHARRGIEVRIPHNELEELAKTEAAKECAYCETPLNWVYGSKRGRIQFDSPTADRFNNEKFLDRDNIRIVCNRCNRAKGEHTYDEFIEYCKRVALLSDIRKPSSA